MSRNPDRDDAANRTQTTRRTMLKAAGAGAAAGMGLSVAGSASARPVGLSETQRELKASYLDPIATRRAFAEHAGEVLAELSSRGLLDRADPNELPLGEFQTPAEYADADGVHVTAMEVGGEDTAHIVASTRTPTHEVEVVVQPELDRAYARATSDDETEYVAPHRDLSTQGYCWWETDCKAECCVVDGDCRATEYERECCKQAGVTDCDYWGPTGNCC